MGLDEDGWCALKRMLGKGEGLFAGLGAEEIAGDALTGITVAFTTPGFRFPTPCTVPKKRGFVTDYRSIYLAKNCHRRGVSLPFTFAARTEQKKVVRIQSSQLEKGCLMSFSSLKSGLSKGKSSEKSALKRLLLVFVPHLNCSY